MKNQNLNLGQPKNLELLTVEEQRKIVGGATTTEYAILVGLLATERNETPREDDKLIVLGRC